MLARGSAASSSSTIAAQSARRRCATRRNPIHSPCIRFSSIVDAARQSVADFGLDITFVDVAAILRSEDFLPVDGHMRPSGHEKVAAALAAAMIDSSVFSPRNPPVD